jgi:NADH-quinone oxidoreductase subunit C
LSTPFYESIRAHLQGQYTRAWDSFGLLVLELEAACLLPVVESLRGEFGCALFLDVTAVDYPQRVPRFEVVYHFLSVAQMQRVRLKLQVDERAAELPTLTHLYGAARYMEREVHEMYGIRFAGNADLRPILLYEGFEGHPLRKDYAMEHEQPIVPYRK